MFHNSGLVVRTTNPPLRKKVEKGLSSLILLTGFLSSAATFAVSLKNIPAPLPTNLADFVKDKEAAIQLGKVLFWDVQAGSNGRQACASCHFHAGVDSRSNDNTVHAGANDVVDTILPLDAADFPFGKTNDDIVGSQGIPVSDFIGLVHGDAVDVCNPSFPNNDTLQKTGRQSPGMIMAIYNRVNFWDGRAKTVFNGVNPGGAGTGAKIWVNNGTALVQQTVGIQPASLASQTVGPPLSGVEMSCTGRIFSDLGRKMINNDVFPLAQQLVAADDSALGTLSKWPDKGLNLTYKDLIRQAFHDKLTSDDLLPSGSGYTQIEENFSLFWGLSVMLYGSTLIPDDSRFDQFSEGRITLTAREQRGLNVFNNKGRCSKCHTGSTFTAASIVDGNLERPFTNNGVRPTAEDGGRQPENKGKFKVPSIRNAELTGPYFHTGGFLTLRQIVDFYNRGGDFNNAAKDSQIRPLGLSEVEKNALVAFMLTLTDERVRCEKGPFDHPSIDISNGPSITQVGRDGRAVDQCLKPFLNANPFTP